MQFKETYIKDNNSVLLFKDECIQLRSSKKIKDKFYTIGKTHKVYTNWYKSNYHDNFYENNREFRAFIGAKSAICKTNNGNEY